MFGTLHGLLVYLVSTVFDIFIYILIFRFLLAATGAMGTEPFVQVIVKLTSFITTPVRRFIPDYKNYELGTLAIIVVLAMIKRLLMTIIPFGINNIGKLILGVIIMGLGDTLCLFGWALVVIVFVTAIMAWVQPNMPRPTLDRIVNPLIRPFQKMIPPVNGLDFSYIPVWLILQLIILFVLNPIVAKGTSIALG